MQSLALPFRASDHHTRDSNFQFRAADGCLLIDEGLYCTHEAFRDLAAELAMDNIRV